MDDYSIQKKILDEHYEQVRKENLELICENYVKKSEYQAEQSAHQAIVIKKLKNQNKKLKVENERLYKINEENNNQNQIGQFTFVGQRKIR